MILKKVLTAFAHTMKVSGAQNNTEPYWLSLYGEHWDFFQTRGILNNKGE